MVRLECLSVYMSKPIIFKKYQNLYTYLVSFSYLTTLGAPNGSTHVIMKNGDGVDDDKK